MLENLCPSYPKSYEDDRITTDGVYRVGQIKKKDRSLTKHGTEQEDRQIWDMGDSAIFDSLAVRAAAETSCWFEVQGARKSRILLLSFPNNIYVENVMRDITNYDQQPFWFIHNGRNPILKLGYTDDMALRLAVLRYYNS